MLDFKSKINLYNEITYDSKSSLNIFVKYKLIEVYKSNIQFYFEYEIAPGDRWDLLANKWYGSPNLWWVIAIFNNVIDPFEQLQSGNVLKMIKLTYVPDILLALRRFKRK